MPIRPKLDELLYQRRMTLTELSERTGVALQNLSILKTGKARAVRFSTLEAICGALDCQPGDVLEFVGGTEPDTEMTRGEAVKGPARVAAAKQIILLLLLAPLLLAVLAPARAAAAVQERPGCTAARAAVPSLTFCVETPGGVVMAARAEEAAQLARHAAAGEQRFHVHFGMAPPPYALLTSTSPRDAEALRALGLRSVLPWASRAAMEASLLQAIRQAAEAGARAQGLPDAQVAAAGEQAIATMRGPVIAGWEARQGGLVPHELGHVWMLDAFWPDERHSGGRRYGSAGPDWLDELAGILMEDDRLSDERRDQFAQIFRGQAASQRLPQITRDRLLDLATFLARDHPSVGSRPGRESGTAGARGNRISVAVSRDGSGSEQTMFYLQTRLFADYLIARSGRSDIFASITRAIAEGRSFDQWLSGAGRSYHLPRNTASLAADWRAWLETRMTSNGTQAR